ncbi:MAG TPA: protease complex subunit PrcB family protein [Gammaproteobacteria bacterium]
MLTLLASCAANSQSWNANEPLQPTPPAMSLTITVLHASSQCAPSVSTQWIASQAQFATLFQATQSHMISPAPPPAPAVDFSQFGVVLLSMGQQRSGGYAIKLAQEELSMHQDFAEIAVYWQEPQPGMMVTQAITHPCIFLRVPRGNYQRVRVVDQNNKLRAELTVI